MRLIDADEALRYMDELLRKAGLVKSEADVYYNQFSYDWIVRYIETRPTVNVPEIGRRAAAAEKRGKET